jgi:hypothetical protein
MTSTLAGLSLWSLWSDATDRRTSRLFAAAVPVGYWAPFFLALLVRGTGVDDPPHLVPRSRACRPACSARRAPPSPRSLVGCSTDAPADRGRRGPHRWQEAGRPSAMSMRRRGEVKAEPPARIGVQRRDTTLSSLASSSAWSALSYLSRLYSGHRLLVAFDAKSNAPMVIRMVIQTTRLHPPRSDQTERAPILTCGNPSLSFVSDCEIPPRNRKVVGSNPTSGSASHASLGRSRAVMAAGRVRCSAAASGCG